MLSLLLLALSLPIDDPVDKDVYVVEERSFDLPNNIPRSSVIEVPKINLFVSIDRGKTWRLYITYPSTIESVHISADADGLYWFAAQLVRYTGEVYPETKDLKPNVKVKVDTSISLKTQPSEGVQTKPATVQEVIVLSQCSCWREDFSRSKRNRFCRCR